MSEQPKPVSAEELLAYALVIEQEAAEGYAELADQMEVHNNREVAGLFHKLAGIEAKHVAKVESLGAGRSLPQISIWDLPWQGPESPETPARDEAHYLMTPHHALSLALAAERRAAAFFASMVEKAEDAEVQAMARQLRDDEQQHVALLEEWIGRYPAPQEGWDEDPDPPAAHE